MLFQKVKGKSAFLCGAVITVVLPSLLTPEAALAQAATPLPPVAVGIDGGITCPLSGSTLLPDPLAPSRLGSSDTATLLGGVPGVNLSTGGGVSSLPSIHGMADDRNKVLVDGMQITSACPNHMNPATSYIDPANVSKVDVMAGITPVSAGGDSIGGTIAIESPRPVFAGFDEKLHTEGSLSAFYRSNNQSVGGSASATAASDKVSLGYVGAFDHAHDYHDGNGIEIATSRYQTQNHAATLAARNDANLLILQGGRQLIPYEGFPNQRMDLVGNQGTFLNAKHEGEYGWGKLDTRVYWQNVEHKMNFLSEKGGSSPGMPMNTDGTDIGYSVKAEIPVSQQDTLRVGNELHRFTLDDWWPPTSQASGGMMSPNVFNNINHGRRNQVGTFAEWESKWSREWTTLLGVRNDTVWMDTGIVEGYSASASQHYATDADAFNKLDHYRRDVNYDLTAMARYEPNATNTDEIGYSRKTRSPNLYERYSWSTGGMAASMNTWFGDGNAYVGNLNLKPETAHTISTSVGWHDSARKEWEAKATPYYTYVQDYIGVDKLGNVSLSGNPFPLLQFANHDAQVYGIDFSGKAGVWNSATYGRGQLKGVVGWLHGETINDHNSLYHMMPLNARTTLEHDLGGWSNAAELQLVARKSQEDGLRNEPTTGGYALVNLRTGYRWESVRVGFGIDNLFNRQYESPLGGMDIGDWKRGGSLGLPGALPGPGRSYNAGVTVTF